MGIWDGLGAAVVSGGLSLFGGSQANDENRAIAAENRHWQEKMANTAHEREVRDLKNAGLNPVLSAMGGSGAATPTPSTPTMQDVVSPAVSSAMASLQTARLRAELDNIQMDTEKKESEKNVNTWVGLKANEEVQNLKEQNSLIRLNQQLAEANVSNAKAQNVLTAASIPEAENEAAFQREAGKWAPWVKNSLGVVKDILGAGSSAKDLLRATNPIHRSQSEVFHYKQ